uniref:Ghrelin O-acyltransferase n=2 Tax=Electrophorus electricus TaxID=8005 RepID=A0A4W4HDX2_ELEEL
VITFLWFCSMGLLSLILHENLQLVYQLLTIPFALLFYCLATQGCLTLINRHVCLMLGGFLLAVLTMGPYCILLFITSIVFVLLVFLVGPAHIHPWIFGLQMCWQTFWHFYIQYQQYWLRDAMDPRLSLAMSALMLLSQRVTSVSMDLQEGKVAGPFNRSFRNQVSSIIPFLSYAFYFPALLGGPLCPVNTYMTFVEQITITPPPSPLTILPSKLLQVLALTALKYLLASFLQSSRLRSSSPVGSPGIPWIWVFSLVLRLNYYAHWKASECLNNAAGLGFSGRGPSGGAVWDRLSDGDAWEIESSIRISAFARRWNATTATWLRRLVFHRSSGAWLLATFAFSALWHGLHPGQVMGFLGWAIAVLADHRLHAHVGPRLSTPWRKGLFTCLSWAYTQVVIAWVVAVTELRSFETASLLGTTPISLFPLASVVILIIL